MRSHTLWPREGTVGQGSSQAHLSKGHLQPAGFVRWCSNVQRQMRWLRSACACCRLVTREWCHPLKKPRGQSLH
eukprot:4350856-Prymnesium_polylepis.1